MKKNTASSLPQSALDRLEQLKRANTENPDKQVIKGALRVYAHITGRTDASLPLQPE